MLFQFNGICHGRQVFMKDLTYTLNGKKLIKSIQQRIDGL